ANHIDVQESELRLFPGLDEEVADTLRATKTAAADSGPAVTGPAVPTGFAAVTGSRSPATAAGPVVPPTSPSTTELRRQRIRPERNTRAVRGP
ncbi:hypothetical protein ACFXOL_01285, partial [Streptomyces californicus]|uniref:hypothetical protein n=1 Tax=Streptomyces californicus TaxID=67351 RepID=UPI0036C2C36B